MDEDGSDVRSHNIECFSIGQIAKLIGSWNLISFYRPTDLQSNFISTFDLSHTLHLLGVVLQTDAQMYRLILRFDFEQQFCFDFNVHGSLEFEIYHGNSVDG